jgi:hypothetical protein
VRQCRIQFSKNRLDVKPQAKHIVKLILEYLGYTLGAGHVDTCPCAWAAERQLVGTDAEDVAIALVAILDVLVETTVHGCNEVTY